MSRRALLICLIVSMVVNVFVIGAVAGALILGGRDHGRMGPPRGGAGLWAAASGLSSERQQAYRAVLREAGPEVRTKMREARRARRAAWLTLREPGFDAAATQASLDHARALEQAARGQVERRIIDYAATLSAAERAKLAEGLARSTPWRGRRGPPQDPGPGPHPK